MYLPLRVVINYIVIHLKVTYVKRLIKHSGKLENYMFPSNYYLFHATVCQCSKVKHLKKILFLYFHYFLDNTTAEKLLLHQNFES